MGRIKKDRGGVAGGGARPQKNREKKDEHGEERE